MPCALMVCFAYDRFAPKLRCAAMPVKTVCIFSRSRNIGKLKTTSQLPAVLHDVEPGFGPGADRLTSRSGASAGSDCRSMRLKIEKMAAFAPIPSASETIATKVTNGVLNSVRSANLRLGIVIGRIDG